MENTVTYLKSITFSRLTLHEKIEIKRKGRPTPQLNFNETANSRGKPYFRKFNPSVYDKYLWVCGCEVTNAMFCFPCLLFGGETEWTNNGISKLKNISPKMSKHDSCKKHLGNVLSLSLLGKIDIRESLSSAHQRSINERNELVKQNRGVLSKIID